METIEWRIGYPMPVTNREILYKGLSGGGMSIYGNARDGSPIIYCHLCKQLIDDPETNMFCFVYMFERAIQMLAPQLNEYVLVIDCENMGYKHVPPVATLSVMSKVFGRHNPRRLGHVSFVPFIERFTDDRLVANIFCAVLF
jgi:hypothetical protein